MSDTKTPTRVVQIYNPRGWWVKIDRDAGVIVGHSPTRWPDVPVVA